MPITLLGVGMGLWELELVDMCLFACEHQVSMGKAFTWGGETWVPAQAVICQACDFGRITFLL